MSLLYLPDAYLSKLFSIIFSDNGSLQLNTAVSIDFKRSHMAAQIEGKRTELPVVYGNIFLITRKYGC